ncbi:glycosyltransferase family 4 protein [Aureimonas mangrovi]|uniref:glycosyltransferase family 4 protein n=1 Tax=Aureimonas mangrovi TaxID=2758041 RepID=UPI001FEAB584|nr:glycosyltransferase family 4 protein [Aureimonas mangrovi]
MRQVAFAIPGDLQTISGGYAYDRRIMAELEALGWEVNHVRLPDAFPRAGETDLVATLDALNALDAGALVVVDGLAFGAMAPIAGTLGARLRLVALVHHPLAQETGLTEAVRAELADGERRALRHTATVIATSSSTAKALEADYEVPANRLHVVRPGTDKGPAAHGGNEPAVLLSVGSVIPRKGHDTMVAALAKLSDLPWRCRIVGGLDRDAAFSASIRAQIDRAGLADRIELVGEAPDSRAEMAAADLFVLPTRHEGYGMVFAEALSQGLPVVACSVGAVPDVVPAEAGVLLPADDPEALADALRGLLADRREVARLARGAKAAGEVLPNWQEAALDFERALRDAAR